MLTATEKQQRQKWIGGSDVAAILGMSSYRTAYDVWLEKTGQDPGEQGESAPADAGSRFEPAVLDKFSESHGPLERKVHLIAEGLGFPLAVNLDARHIAERAPVEAKTSGLFGPLDPEWGDEGTDEIPQGYILQCQAEIVCAKSELCYVPAFLGGRGFVTEPPFLVRRNKELIQLMLDRLGNFWNGHVLKDIPPEDSLPTLEIVKRIRRIPESSVQIDPEIMQRWLDAKAKTDAAEEWEKQCKAAILAALGKAEGGMGGDQGNVTYYEQSKTGFDATRLQTDKPDIYAEYVKKSTFRVLRHQKPKKKGKG
jgi:putative phage-type endonuclease